jgi:hypothetical protein
MSEELRPCPFCGEQVFPPLASSLDDGYTRCGLCGAKMQHRRWQTRPIEDALQARIAELTECIGSQMADVYTLKARIAKLEAAQRWIPVSERLPEDMRNVLGLSRNAQLVVSYIDEYKMWYAPGADMLRVTHWMPLPQPPEVQQ